MSQTTNIDDSFKSSSGKKTKHRIIGHKKTNPNGVVSSRVSKPIVHIRPNITEKPTIVEKPTVDKKLEIAKKAAIDKKNREDVEAILEILRSIQDMFQNTFRREEYRLQVSTNVLILEAGGVLEPVNFIYGEKPEDLPPINRIEDIDSFTKEECITYLKGYDQYSDFEKTTDLKRKVAFSVGFRRSEGWDYPWSPF